MADNTFKSSQDGLDGCSDVVEFLRNPRPVGWRPLSERYVEGHARIHVHLGQRYAGHANLLHPTHLCATFKWPHIPHGHHFELNVRRAGERWLENPTLHTNEESRKGHMAMLVDVPKFVKHPKGVSGVLPTVKGLQRLQVCRQVIADAPEFSRSCLAPGDKVARGVRRRGVEFNREGDVSPFSARLAPRDDGGRSVPIDESELPNQVVQGGAEVVHDVPDDDAPLGNRWLPQGFSVDDYLACIEVVIRFNSVRVAIHEPLYPFAKVNQVLFCPTELGPTSGEVGLTGHGE
jgi:hypothetical protein